MSKHTPANARLHAAAPELLHRLKWFMSMLECGTLVRDISQDSGRDFPIRMAGFVSNLKKAQVLIDSLEDA